MESSGFLLLWLGNFLHFLLLDHLSCRLEHYPSRWWEFGQFIWCVLIFALGFLKLEIWLIDRLHILRISYSILILSPPCQPAAPPAEWIHPHEELHRVPPSRPPPRPWYTILTSLPPPVAAALPPPSGIPPDSALAWSAEHTLQSPAPLAPAAHTISPYSLSLSQPSTFPYPQLPVSCLPPASVCSRFVDDHSSAVQSVSYVLLHSICFIWFVDFAVSARLLASCCDIYVLPIFFHFFAFRLSDFLFLFFAWRFGFHTIDFYFWPFWASNL